MARFKGPEIVKQIDEAIDKGLARFLINTQSKLSAVRSKTNCFKCFNFPEEQGERQPLA